MWIKKSTDQFFEVLAQVIMEPVSRAASEKNVLAHILRTNGMTFQVRDVDPDKLYRELVFERNEGRAKTIAEHSRFLLIPGRRRRAHLRKVTSCRGWRLDIPVVAT